MRKRRGTCIYCGKRRRLTADHVPPKLFLARPYPHNLITVPACRECNASFQRNDEYVRLVICHDERSGRNPVARTVIPVVFRSLQRPQGEALARYLDSQRQQSSLHRSDGTHVRFIYPDRTRIDPVGERMIRALHFHETGRRIKPPARIKTAAKVGLAQARATIVEYAKVLITIPERYDRSIGDGFSYVAGFEPDFSIWLLMLYENLIWMGTVEYRPKQQAV